MSDIGEKSSCNHVIIDDGCYEVCIKCAFVCGDIFTSVKTDYNSYECFKDNDISLIQQERISQILELESRGLISNIIVDRSRSLLKEWSEKKIPYQKYHHAYAVFIAARENNHPISLKELSYYLQISLKNICKIEKFIKYDFSDSPFEYLSKFCSLLNLTFTDEKIVKLFLTNHYTQSDKPPAHIAAGAIFATFPKINLHELSKISWTTPPTIKKITTQLRARAFL
ncbi:hypothetical protein [Aeromonas sobria]|uniref:cyclin family protein n=1 Tax=Aeromonas sobria TaxID=646 RepID=UPI003F3CCF8C